MSWSIVGRSSYKLMSCRTAHHHQPHVEYLRIAKQPAIFQYKFIICELGIKHENSCIEGNSHFNDFVLKNGTFDQKLRKMMAFLLQFAVLLRREPRSPRSPVRARTRHSASQPAQSSGGRRLACPRPRPGVAARAVTPRSLRPCAPRLPWRLHWNHHFKYKIHHF